MDTYPESYITKYASVRREFPKRCEFDLGISEQVRFSQGMVVTSLDASVSKDVTKVPLALSLSLSLSPSLSLSLSPSVALSLSLSCSLSLSQGSITDILRPGSVNENDYTDALLLLLRLDCVAVRIADNESKIGRFSAEESHASLHTFLSPILHVTPSPGQDRRC